MKKILKAFLIAVVATAASAQPAAQPSADAIAARAIDVLGGAAWPQARYFAFTMNIVIDGKVVSSFPQKWDRVTGDYQVNGKDPQGRPFELVMNVNTRKGRVTISNQRIEGSKVGEFLANLGMRRYVNDTFWLLMPLRMTEPGVTREYVGERSDSCGRVWDVLKLTFAGGALAPGDEHWAWVNRDTGIVDEWDMKVPPQEANQRPAEVTFHEFRRAGGLYLSTRRDVRGTSQWIRIDDLQVLPATPKGAFQ